MKPNYRLVTNVRALFGFFRWAPLFSLIVVVGGAFIPVGPIKSWVEFAAPMEKIQATAKNLPSITLKEVRANVEIPIPWDSNPELMTLNRLTQVPSNCVYFLTLGIMFDLIWRLCGLIEHGEMFSERTVKFLRWLGTILIAKSILDCAAQTWAHVEIFRYVKSHYTFPGLPPLADPTKPLNLVGGSDAWVYGLLVLVLVEVFRQGLAMKQESELTV